jgi:hypothetical protein
MHAFLAPLEAIQPVTRNATRRSPRRLLLTICVVFCGLVATGVAVAAGLGAFSGNATIADIRACDPSTVALKTPSGAQVLTGHTDAGVYCVAYKDPNGAGGATSAKFGETPVGQAVAAKVLDTASKTYVIVGVVPPGYSTLSVGGAQIPIKNQAFVIDPKLAANPASLSGTSGAAAINLKALAELTPVTGSQ